MSCFHRRWEKESEKKKNLKMHGHSMFRLISKYRIFRYKKSNILLLPIHHFWLMKRQSRNVPRETSPNKTLFFQTPMSRLKNRFGVIVNGNNYHRPINKESLNLSKRINFPFDVSPSTIISTVSKAKNLWCMLDTMNESRPMKTRCMRSRPRFWKKRMSDLEIILC